MTALLANQLDMAYVGPSPAVNAFVQSNGTALKIVAGVASGGAAFVVRNNDGINSTSDFKGKTFAAPQLGNTQDIALRSYLLRNHYVVGVNVTIDDTSNANILTLMTQGNSMEPGCLNLMPPSWFSRLTHTYSSMKGVSGRAGSSRLRNWS